MEYVLVPLLASPDIWIMFLYFSLRDIWTPEEQVIRTQELLLEQCVMVEHRSVIGCDRKLRLCCGLL